MFRNPIVGRDQGEEAAAFLDEYFAQVGLRLLHMPDDEARGTTPATNSSSACDDAKLITTQRQME